MKRVLYISNIQVPYRVRFFNLLAEQCDLTVLYERSQPGSRDITWAKSVQEKYKAEFLDGIKIGNESSFSFKILKYLMADYDEIIIGCYSTPVQMFANLFLRMIRKPFIMNFDGEIFADDNSFKSHMKKLFIKGASKYVIAGEHAASSLKKISGMKPVYPYYFSSMLEKELKEHSVSAPGGGREAYILVVGQYYPYKGMDVAVRAAKLLPDMKFKFVGMGKRTKEFLADTLTDQMKNVEVIPFLQKDALEEEYKRCSMLVLPTRQECWGLVVNEAASFGTPIVSTYGSGAAVEFLMGKYDSLLATPGDSDSLKQCILNLSKIDLQEYSNYLIEKSKCYSIETCVEKHLESFCQ